MRTLASILIFLVASQITLADEKLTDESFLGIWKTIEIDDSKHSNRAILILPDRLIDITDIDQLKPGTTELDSCTVKFVAVTVQQNVLQGVLKYHRNSSIESGRLTIRHLKERQAEIRYTLVSNNGKRWFSKYKVVRFEAGKTPPKLSTLVKSYQQKPNASKD